jgi:Papain fold toxin 1, glutamine deamidase
VLGDAGDKAAKEAVEKAAKEAKDKVNKEIDGTLAKLNPKYDPNKSAYSENCTSVVQANELRRRGQDVQPGPLEKHLWSSEGGPGGRGYDSMEGPWGRKFTSAGKDDIVKAFEGYGDGARGIVSIHWNKGGGHVFNVENVGGQVRFIDAQPNPGLTDASSHFNSGGGTRYLRLDDLPTPDASKMKRFLE